MFGSGTLARMRRAIGLMRSAGMMLPGNCVRPAPVASPVSGSKIGTLEALKSPLRIAIVGMV